MVISITILIVFGLPYLSYEINSKTVSPNTKSYDLLSYESSRDMLIRNHEIFDQLIQYFMSKKLRVLYNYNGMGVVTLIDGDPESAVEQQESLETVQNFLTSQRASGLLPSNSGGSI